MTHPAEELTDYLLRLAREHQLAHKPRKALKHYLPSVQRVLKERDIQSWILTRSIVLANGVERGVGPALEVLGLPDVRSLDGLVGWGALAHQAAEGQAYTFKDKPHPPGRGLEAAWVDPLESVHHQSLLDTLKVGLEAWDLNRETHTAPSTSRPARI